MIKIIKKYNKYIVFLALCIIFIVATASLFSCNNKYYEEHASDKDRKPVIGTWEYRETTQVPYEAGIAFNNASEKYKGMELTLIEYLGRKVQSDGTYYKFLCEGLPYTPDAETADYEITVFAGENDIDSITHVKKL